MSNDPLVITRRSLGQWASFIGGIALLIGVIGFVWQGGLTAYIIAILLVGVVGIGLWALLTPSEFIGFVTGRQARYGTTAVFSTILLIGIVSLVYILLERAVITGDMTEGRRFTLSSETLDVLKRNRRDMLITGFYSPSELPQREVDDQFFRLYEVQSEGVISRQFVDPLEQPGIAQGFAQRFGLLTYPNNVFISFVNPDGTIDIESTTRVPRSSRQERDMTQAILRLLISGELTVYFETSHGEYDPLDETQQGLSLIHSEVQGNGIRTQPLSLMELATTGESVPFDASTIVIAHPLTQFSAEEIAVLDAYLQQGGALFILTDALFSEAPFMAEGSLFNQYLWDNFGLRALDAVIVDPAASSQTPLDIVSYQVFSDSEIGANLNVEGDQDTATLFRLARPLEVSDTPPVPNGRIIMTSPQGYGETNLKALRETDTYTYDEGVDIPGPLTTVAWARNQETNGRILLVGDGEFITNGQIRSPLGNSILFMDGLSWLTGFGEQVRFAPTAYSSGLPFFTDVATLDIIAFITVILMPGVVLAAGIGIWWRRVRR